jgi:hypothetical protein
MQGFGSKSCRKEVRSFALPRRRWEANMKVGLKQIGWVDVNWIRLAQDKDHWCAIVNTKINLRVPVNAGNFLTS